MNALRLVIISASAMLLMGTFLGATSQGQRGVIPFFLGGGVLVLVILALGFVQFLRLFVR